MNDTLEIKTKPVREEILRPSEFVKIPKKDIHTSRVIPPRIGSKSLGAIKVVYKNIKYRPI